MARWQPVDVLAKARAGTGTLCDLTPGAGPAADQGRRCQGEIGGGESASETATSGRPATLGRKLPSTSRSTHLAGGERCSAANTRASIAMSEGQGIQTPIPCPSRSPIPASKPELSILHKSGTFYFALTARLAARLAKQPSENPGDVTGRARPETVATGGRRSRGKARRPCLHPKSGGRVIRRAHRHPRQLRRSAPCAAERRGAGCR